MNTRPGWIEEVHERASQTIREISDDLLDRATDICSEETRSNNDGVIFIPIIVLAAVQEHSLITSACQFGMQSSAESVARLLRLTADHLEGKTHDGQFVAERGRVR